MGSSSLVHVPGSLPQDTSSFGELVLSKSLLVFTTLTESRSHPAKVRPQVGCGVSVHTILHVSSPFFHD